MFSKIEAIVVDLPQPVAPVIKTIPFSKLANFSTVGGNPNCSLVGISYGIRRTVIAW